jgi:hypothetical protein
MFSDKTEDHFARYRRQLRRDHFPEVSLHMIFSGITHAAMSADCPIASMKPGIGR